MLIGQGYTMDEATKEVKMVVEGIYSAKAALALAEKYDVRMPIIEEVNRVLLRISRQRRLSQSLCFVTGRLSTQVWSGNN